MTRKRLADYRAAWSTWGVAGRGQWYNGEGHVQVQAFAQQGTTMYVGGNFATVQKGKNATGNDRVAQPYLAAFHQKTGDYLPSFRPTLDGEVKGIAALPGDRIAIVGAFRTVNGEPRSGVAVLNADGSLDAGFAFSLENRVAGSTLILRAVRYQNGRLYLGGAFTHGIGGGAANPIYARNAMRVDAATGRPDGAWNPALNGTVMALDPSEDNNRVYLAGFFSTSQGNDAYKAAAVQATAGASLATPAWKPVWSHATANYQQAIDQVGGDVWVGGSNHSMFSFTTGDFDRKSTSIGHKGGDIQTISSGVGVTYAGCHCNHYWYDGATTWPLDGPFTNAEKITWMGAWDQKTRRFIPEFSPILTTEEGAGAWASYVDSDNALWVGGDITSSRYTANQAQWSGGFARFPETDYTAPTRPSITWTSTSATNVILTWTKSTDVSWPVTYQIIRDDRVIATTRDTKITVPRGGENRFFVRAVDPNGNISASSTVAKLKMPSTPGPVTEPVDAPAQSTQPSPTPTPSPTPASTPTATPVKP